MGIWWKLQSCQGGRRWGLAGNRDHAQLLRDDADRQAAETQASSWLGKTHIVLCQGSRCRRGTADVIEFRQLQPSLESIMVWKFV